MPWIYANVIAMMNASDSSTAHAKYICCYYLYSIFAVHVDVIALTKTLNFTTTITTRYTADLLIEDEVMGAIIQHHLILLI
jgi:hypothetical protein